MSRHHVIISGTGRAGTTFLVHLLSALKLDTGFDNPASCIDPHSNAGMEFDIRQANAPYIVKSPWLCDYLDDVIQAKKIVIDHAIIPVRDLYSAAESRRAVFRKAGPAARSYEVPGGLWHTKVPGDQESILTQQLYKLFFALAKHDIPVTLLSFPRLVNEPEYLYKKIGFLLPDISYDAFLQCFREIGRPELVHDFRADSYAPHQHFREEGIIRLPAVAKFYSLSSRAATDGKIPHEISEVTTTFAESTDLPNIWDDLVTEHDAAIKINRTRSRKQRQLFTYISIAIFVILALISTFKLVGAEDWFK